MPPNNKIKRGYKFKFEGREYELIELYSNEIRSFASVKNLKSGLYELFNRNDIPGYNEDVNLSFTASSSKNDPVNSPNLTGYKGSKIYFIRFGLMKKNEFDYSSFSYQEKPETQIYLEKETPDVVGFKYCRRPIRDGYLYVYDQYSPGTLPDQYHEYKVENGKLRKILWTSDNCGDIRNPSGDFIDYHKIPQSVDTIWVAYSEVQWSKKYALDLLNTESEKAKELREKKFTKIAVIEWFSIYDFTGSNSYDDTLAVDDIVIYTKKIESIDPLSHLEQTVNNFENYIKKDKEVLETNKKTGKKLDVTLYFTVHDPIGAADDICEVLNEFNTNFDLFLESIRRGVDIENLKSDINYFGTDAIDRANLAELTASLYPLLYKPESHFRKYNNNASELKFTAILRPKERADFKRKIDDVRNTLASFLASKYYQDAMDDFKLNINNRVLDGQLRWNTHNANLCNNPHLRDAHITQFPQVSEQEKVQTYITECLAENSKFAELMNIDLDLLDIIDTSSIDDMDRISILWLTILDTYPRFLKANNCYEFIAKNINKIIIHQTPSKKGITKPKDAIRTRINRNGQFWIFEETTILKYLGKKGFVSKTDFIKGVFGNKKRPLIAVANITDINIKTLGPNPVLIVGLPPKYTQWVDKFLKSVNYHACVNALSILNLRMALEEIQKTDSTYSKIWAICGIAELATLFGTIILNSQKQTPSTVLSVKGLGHLQNFTGVVMSFLDARSAKKNRDYDAMIAAGCTTLALSTLWFYNTVGNLPITQKTIQASVSTARSSALSTVFQTKGMRRMWIASVIIVIGTIVYIYLLDTPFEAFLKNGLLCTDEKDKGIWNSLFSKAILSSNDLKNNEIVITKLLEKCDDIVGDNFKSLANPEIALQQLESLLPPIRVEVAKKTYTSFIFNTNMTTSKSHIEQIAFICQTFNYATDTVYDFRLIIGGRYHLYSEHVEQIKMPENSDKYRKVRPQIFNQAIEAPDHIRNKMNKMVDEGGKSPLMAVNYNLEELGITILDSDILYFCVRLMSPVYADTSDQSEEREIIAFTSFWPKQETNDDLYYICKVPVTITTTEHHSSTGMVSIEHESYSDIDAYKDYTNKNTLAVKSISKL